MSFTKVAPAGIGTEPGTSIRLGDSLLHSTGLDIGTGTGIGVTIRQHGDATFTGIVTAASFSGSGANLTGIDATSIKHTDGNVKVQAINTGANLTGNLAVSGNATVTGTLGVGGVLTYEDVTNIDSVGVVTARSGIKIGPTAGVAGTFFADGSYVTAGIITAGSYRGDGSNLTGITQTTINNNATTKFITGTNNANELDCEANLSYNNSVVTFASSNLTINKSASPTISVTETAGSKSGQFRTNTDGVLLRSLGNYPLIFHTNQTERAQIDGSGRFLIGTNSVYNANSYANNLIVYENGDAGASIIGNASNSNYASLYLSDTSTAIKGYLEAQLGANGNFTIGAVGSGPIRFTNNGSERFRITGDGKVSISSDGTTDGLLTIKGNSDQINVPSIRLLDGSDTREVSISNTSGDFVASVHGNDNAIHGHIKMFESGIFDINNGGASGSNVNRLRINVNGDVLIPGNQATSSETGKLDIYHTADGDINNPHIRLWGTTNADPRIEFGSPTNSGEGGYIMYNDSDEALYIGSRMATYSEVNICTGMNDGDPATNIRFSVSSVGNVTKPVQPGFEASYPDAYNTSNSPSNYVTQWLRVHHNYGSHFNANNGRFTAPVNGRYLIGTIWTNVSQSNPHCAFGINGGAASGPSRGGTNYTELWHTNAGSGSGLSPVHIFDLSANDYVNVWIYNFTGTPDDPRCYFFGYLLG